MAALSNKQRITIVTIVFWVLLAYIVAALVWWFISLENQNRLMTSLRLQEITSTGKLRQQQQAAIVDLKQRKTAQYVGEGSIFLLLILLGALYIFRAIRRELLLSQQQQNFMMAVTHELKTPIAITTLNLETLQKRKLDEQQQQRLIANSLQETTRLNDLCSNILLTAQLEADNDGHAKEQLELNDIAEESVSHFRVRFPNRTFFLSPAETSLIIQGELLAIQMLVNNLVENAIKYSPKNASITVKLFEEGANKVLQVIDEGLGIPDNEKKKVFDKFYRIGDERTRTSKGTGLGLYLCKKIAQNHHATIQLTDNVPQGSIFTITFRS